MTADRFGSSTPEGQIGTLLAMDASAAKIRELHAVDRVGRRRQVRGMSGGNPDGRALCLVRLLPASKPAGFRGMVKPESAVAVPGAANGPRAARRQDGGRIGAKR